VPTLLSALLDEPTFAACRTLRHVFCGGEVLTRDLQDRFFATHSAALHNLYGPTEATIDATFWTCERTAEDPTVPIGHPTRNMRAYVLDDALQPVPIGVVGELHLGGVGLATGYLHRPALTAERFIPNPFGSEPGDRLYKTGDLATYRADGALLYAGRRDHQVKLRGLRVELGEIEATLRQHASVREVVVVARDDHRGGRKLVAYVATHAGQSATPGELRSSVKANLPDYMAPATFVFLEELPQTPNGKVDRLALPDPSRQRNDLDDRYAAPQTATEQAAARIWSSVLGVDTVGLYDNFFDLGGYSLQLVEVLAAIEQQLGVRVNPAYVQTQTLGQLAAVCDEMIAKGETRDPKPSLSRNGKLVGTVRRMLGAGSRQSAR